MFVKTSGLRFVLCLKQKSAYEMRVSDWSSDVCSSDLPAELAPERLRALAAIDLATLPLVAATERLGPPITGTRQFLAIGLNYSDHARESGMDIPAEPVLFTKGVSCIQGPNDPIVIPREIGRAHV